MSVRVRCTETDSRPPVLEVEVPPGDGFVVYLLGDTLEGVGDLRSTVVKRRGDHPAQGSMLVAEFDVLDETGGEPQLIAREVGHLVDVEHVRPGMRTRLLPMSRFGPEARFEVVLPSQRRVQFGLDIEWQGTRTARAALAGSGTVPKRKAQGAAGTLWLLPTAYNLMYDTRDQAFDSIKAVASKLGLSPRLVANLASLLSVIFVGAMAWYVQKGKTDEQAAARAAAEEALARSRASTALALQGEQACLQERRELVDKLGDIAEGMQLQVDAALQASSSQGVALEFGGASMARKEVRARDAVSLDALRKRLASLLPEMEQPGADSSRCLAFERQLGTELPRYVLLWHPDPTVSCPPDYGRTLDGGWSVGRWGLSERAAAEFGVIERAEGYEDLEPEGDPRANERWAADTFIDGLLATERALLEWRFMGRIPVAPSQAQVWSLALFAGYNGMSSPTEGVLDEPLGVCVEEFLNELAADAAPPEPGEPLLPDLLDVAEGRIEVRARPTPGCPWSNDALLKGAQGALTAVGRAAHLADPEEQTE